MATVNFQGEVRNRTGAIAVLTPFPEPKALTWGLVNFGWGEGHWVSERADIKNKWHTEGNARTGNNLNGSASNIWHTEANATTKEYEPYNIEDYLKLVPWQHRRPKFLAFLKSILSGMVNQMNFAYNLSRRFDVDTAIGIQHDKIGDWEGIKRSDIETYADVTNLSDDIYRNFVKAKIAANHWNGTIPHAYEMWDGAFRYQSFIALEDHQDMSMTMYVLGIDNSDIFRIVIERGLISFKPAGVWVNYLFAVPAGSKFLAWSLENDIFAGWGKGCWAAGEIVIKPYASIPVTGISINPSAITLDIDEITTLIATVAPNYASNKFVTWSSSNNGIVTVINNNAAFAETSAMTEIKGVSEGTATITAMTADGSCVAVCEVTVVIFKIVPVTGVEIDKHNILLDLGGDLMAKTGQLTAIIIPSNATNKGVTWSSDDDNVATVNSAGLVTAVDEGTATITVKTIDGAYTDDCEVTVQLLTVKVTGVTLNKNNLALGSGWEETLVATVSPSNATNKGVTWSSSDTTLATVDSNGKVTANTTGKAGPAVITVTTDDGGIYDECVVAVQPVSVTGVELDQNTMTLDIEP